MAINSHCTNMEELKKEKIREGQGLSHLAQNLISSVPVFDPEF